ncbi:hypothetical protein [Mammaliicoccus sciuri]|nr:hypothetical protein [Mammaliicoccus sciuri]UXV31652.1 hypothetical protein MUA60_11970 [Mammaliicoccus sciuri]
MAIEYSNYKEKLAGEYNETAGYSKAKKSYVKNLEQQAIRWYKEK